MPSHLKCGKTVLKRLNLILFLLGEIRLKKALDYESSNKDYTFDVAATDGGGKESTGKVKIFVTDVNDNEPEFQNQPYRENVAENVNVGHVVGTVLATDKDSGPRGRVSYSITAGGENAFRINAAGKLKSFSWQFEHWQNSKLAVSRVRSLEAANFYTVFLKVTILMRLKFT